MLTDTAVRRAAARDKGYYLNDSRGLYLYVSHTGTKVWRFRYRFGGKPRILSLGDYPAMSLADARAERDEARANVKAGRDPAIIKRTQRVLRIQHASDTFESIAREWHENRAPGWDERHAKDVLHSLERMVFPQIGSFPIREITVPMVLDVVRAIEAKPAIETARRVRQRMSAIFGYAIATDRAVADPAAAIKSAMKPLIKGKQPAVTTLDEAREVLKRAEQEGAHPVTKLALRLLALTVLRPGTLATTPWSELETIDEDAPVWQVPAARMKMRLENKKDPARDHLVPLPRQALEVIEALKPLSGRSPYVFPNTRWHHRPMSENAMGYLLNRAGYHHRHVPHGWRATFSTIMNERRPEDRAVIDLMLAHTPKDRVEASYNRALHLERRRIIAQEWADLLLEGRPPASELVHGPRRLPDVNRSRR